MTINAPAALLLLLYELVAEGQGVGGDMLRGTVQNDVLKGTSRAATTSFRRAPRCA